MAIDPKKEFQQGLKEIAEYEAGERRLMTKVMYISLPRISWAEARQRLGLSQREFSLVFGIPLSTLKNWEQKRRLPNGVAANLLLRLIISRPKDVAEEVAKAKREAREIIKMKSKK